MTAFLFKLLIYADFFGTIEKVIYVMKNCIKAIALLLVILMLTGCNKNGANKTGSNPNSNQIVAQMTAEETEIADWLKGIYGNLSSNILGSSIKNSTADISSALLSLGKSYEGKTVEKLIAKEIGNHGEGKLYCVALLFSDSTLINDVLLIEDSLIVIQGIYDEDTQIELSDTYESYLFKIEDAFAVCNRELGSSSKATSTFISVAISPVTLTDESGNRIVYIEFEISGVRDNQLIHSEEEKKTETDVPQNKGNRKLVWNHEFNVMSTGELISHLTNTVDHMFSRDTNLVTSMDQKNYFVKDGNLVLRITSNGNKKYTTARSVSTYNIMSFKYGYLEMRAKIPYQLGVWPGFWMKADKNYQKSKYGGEIDIFEVFSSKDTCVPNLHKWYGGSYSDQIGNKGVFSGQRKYVFANSENLSNTYHIYGFEWTAEEMKFYVDGECYYTVSIREEDDFSTDHPGMDCFHDFYYVCFNNWVFTDQQNWADSSLHVENLEDFGSADYVIDYVRLYQGSGEDIKLY